MWGFLAVLFGLMRLSLGLKHNLEIEKDDRHLFKVETFGFNRGGKIDISFHDFSMEYPASMSKADIKKSTTEGFRAWERVDTAYITLEPFAMANGQLTQSYKVKRASVMERYGDEL